MTNEFDENKLLRYSIYALLIVATLSTSTARIMTARSTDRHTPFFSANDRSRWSAISAVVDEGTYHAFARFYVSSSYSAPDGP